MDNKVGIFTTEGEQVEKIDPNSFRVLDRANSVTLYRGWTATGKKCVVLSANGKAIALPVQTWDNLTSCAGSFLEGW